jgi:hypothetical protein
VVGSQEKGIRILQDWSLKKEKVRRRETKENGKRGKEKAKGSPLFRQDSLYPYRQ